jgi:hypothetical protein
MTDHVYDSGIKSSGRRKRVIMEPSDSDSDDHEVIAPPAKVISPPEGLLSIKPNESSARKRIVLSPSSDSAEGPWEPALLSYGPETPSQANSVLQDRSAS